MIPYTQGKNVLNTGNNVREWREKLLFAYIFIFFRLLLGHELAWKLSRRLLETLGKVVGV